MRIAVDRIILITLRAALIQALNAVEDALSMPRSIARGRQQERDAA